MSTLSPPNSRPSQAPERSPALIALQGKGLELPSPRNEFISSSSNRAIEHKLRLSPLSITSTFPNLDDPLDSFDNYDDGRPSAISFETEVSNILNLYMNASKQSLKSEYEDLAALSDADDMEEERISVPTFHEPKAYRDTIVPLLEHQFGGDRLTAPVVPSPISVASMPVLVHSSANRSISSVNFTPETSPILLPVYQSTATTSGSSIQITPEMSPQLPAKLFSVHDYASHATNGKMPLEVPDVRQAESWYDQPLSPVSPEDITIALRASQMSAVSPDGNDRYQRQLTFEALAPPQPQKSPSARPVDYYEDTSLPRPSRGIVSEVVDDKMVPPPLDLHRGKSPSNVLGKSTLVHQPLMHVSNGDDSDDRSQHASLILRDPIEGPMRLYLSPAPTDRVANASPSSNLTLTREMEEIYGPGSAFSDSTADSPVAMGKLGRQLKKALKDSFGRKNKKKKKTPKADEKPNTEAAPDPTFNLFMDNLESYKYGYWKSHAMAPVEQDNVLPPPHRLLSPNMESAHRLSVQSALTDSLQSDPNLSIRGRLESFSKPGERPTTQPADQDWHDTNNQKRVQDSLSSQASIIATNYPVYMHQSRPHTRTFTDEQANPDRSERDTFSFHNRPLSRMSHVYAMSESTDTSRQSTRSSSISGLSSLGQDGARKSILSYNNDLFEASGGKKRSGFASRLLMSAEEKRKQKVKESIIVVGGAKMGGSSVQSGEKSLVRI